MMCSRERDIGSVSKLYYSIVFASEYSRIHLNKLEPRKAPNLVKVLAITKFMDTKIRKKCQKSLKQRNNKTHI